MRRCNFPSENKKVRGKPRWRGSMRFPDHCTNTGCAYDLNALQFVMDSTFPILTHCSGSRQSKFDRVQGRKSENAQVGNTITHHYLSCQRLKKSKHNMAFTKCVFSEPLFTTWCCSNMKWKIHLYTLARTTCQNQAITHIAQNDENSGLSSS